MKFISVLFNLPGYVVLLFLRMFMWNRMKEGEITERTYERSLSKGSWHHRFPFLKWLTSICFWGFVALVALVHYFPDSGIVAAIEKVKEMFN